MEIATIPAGWLRRVPSGSKATATPKGMTVPLTVKTERSSVAIFNCALVDDVKINNADETVMPTPNGSNVSETKGFKSKSNRKKDNNFGD